MIALRLSIEKGLAPFIIGAEGKIELLGNSTASFPLQGVDAESGHINILIGTDPAD